MTDGTNLAAAALDTPLTAAEIPAQVDSLIALHLNLWPALTVAIQNGWGTSSPDVGADKRAWLAGAISDLFEQKQLRDAEDLEEVLDQVMSDEFEVVVDDGTLEEVARAIWKGREKVLAGDGSEVRKLQTLWETKRAKGAGQITTIVEQGQDDDEDDDDDSVTDEEEWNGFSNHRSNTADVEMDEAPTLVDSQATKSKPEPEIDEDGFTKVVSKKKR